MVGPSVTRSFWRVGSNPFSFLHCHLLPLHHPVQWWIIHSLRRIGGAVTDSGHCTWMCNGGVLRVPLVFNGELEIILLCSYSATSSHCNPQWRVLYCPLVCGVSFGCEFPIPKGRRVYLMSNIRVSRSHNAWKVIMARLGQSASSQLEKWPIRRGSQQPGLLRVVEGPVAIFVI